MKTKVWIAIISILILSGSCTTTKFISIEVMAPATVNFAPDVVNLVVVDNALLPPDSTNHSAISMSEIHKVPLVSPDSSKIIFKEALLQFMNELNYFNEVKLYPHEMKTEGDVLIVDTLPKDKIREICSAEDADALISIDIFFDATNLKMGLVSGSVFELSAGMAILTNVYDRNGNCISPSIILSDSAFWDNTHSGEGIPPREFALKELALMSAERLTNKLIPHWERQDRWYYSNNNSEMKKAAKLAKEGKWREAALIWGAAFEKEKKNTNKAKIASNIALANECSDDIKNAVKWIAIASSYLEEKENSELKIKTDRYSAWLKIRESNISKLKYQLDSKEEKKKI